MKLARCAPAGRASPLSDFFARQAAKPAQQWRGLQADLYQSGTAALAAALRAALDALPAGAERRVALPAYGCPNLAAAALWAGGEIVYYDISSHTLSAADQTIDALLSTGDTVVVRVDAFGATSPPALESDRVIDDLAQSFAAYGDAWVPRAPYSILSFGRAKPLALTLGGAVLSMSRLGAAVAASLGDHPVISLARWRGAIRAAVYSLCLNPMLFGMLSRVPQLGIGQTRFSELDEVRRLPVAWRSIVASAIQKSRDSFERHISQTQVVLRLAKEAGAEVPACAVIAGERAPLWRVPVLCATEENARYIAMNGAHLGLSRLYGASLPEIMGTPQQQVAAEWPHANAIASRLITLPTHGRLGAGALSELQSLLERRGR